MFELNRKRLRLLMPHYTKRLIKLLFINSIGEIHGRVEIKVRQCLNFLKFDSLHVD